MLRWAELWAEAGQSGRRGWYGPAKAVQVGAGISSGQPGRPGGSGLLLLLLSGGGVEAPIEAGLQPNPFSWRGEHPKRSRSEWSLGLG